MDAQKFGRTVQQRRQACQMSQQALAVEAGLAVQTVSKIEQGLVADPGVSTVSRLARALGTTVDQMLKEAA